MTNRPRIPSHLSLPAFCRAVDQVGDSRVDQAERLGLKWPTLQEYVSGRRPIPYTVARLAELLAEDQHTASATDSTRSQTPEGMLKAGAIITRSGPISYTRGEIGLPGDEETPITVDRTLETISHPDTLDSLRGKPITLGHPADGVHPENYKDTVVGAVAGEPRVVGDVVVADVLIGDKDALKRLEDGVEELSIGLRLYSDREQDRRVGCYCRATCNQPRCYR